MSRNQKAPLLAFVLVAMVCGLILVDSVRGDARARFNVLGPTVQQSPSQPPREPQLPTSGEEGEASEAPPGAVTDLPYPLGSADGGTADDPFAGTFGTVGPDGTQDPPFSMSSPLGSLSASASGTPGAASGSDPGQEPVDPPTGSDGTSGSEGTADGEQSTDGSLGLKNPTAGMANFGPDGGRPEIDPEHPEPLPETGAGTDAVDNGTPADPGTPADAAGPVDPAGPADPTDPDNPLGAPDVLPANLQRGGQDQADTKADKGHKKGQQGKGQN